MNKAPTIAAIAAHNEKAGGHYFDKGTLRFFGQRRADFHARTLKDGRIVVYAFTHRRWDNVSFGGKPSSLAVYDPKTGDMSTPADKDAIGQAIADGKRKI
jgi:hypothetical protein